MPEFVPDVLRRLLEGNRRYVVGRAERALPPSAAERARLASGQAPVAAVLACADSRVPVELVLDQAPGELFVVRVAGNVPAPAVLGSLEFAVTVLRVPLVLVLGHNGCGAVSAALDLAGGGDAAALPEHLRGLVEGIRPAVSAAPDPSAAGGGRRERLAAAVRQNVRAALRGLARSGTLAAAISAGDIAVAGAVYDVTSGEVRLLPPEAEP